MTLFDLAVVIAAVAIGTWGAFLLASMWERIWFWLKDIGSPLRLFNKAGFVFFCWQTRLDRARSYRSRHSGMTA